MDQEEKISEASEASSNLEQGKAEETEPKQQHDRFFFVAAAGIAFCILLACYYAGQPISIWNVNVSAAPQVNSSVGSGLDALSPTEDDWNEGPWEHIQTETEEPLEANSIDLNTADSAQLDRLPGIGQELAQRIMTYREQSGGFSSVEDLLNVDGIGEKTLQKISEYVFVN